MVISRIKTEYYVSKNFVDMMENLFASSPNCFCYCFYHPTVGFWMGATPELLFFQDAKETAFLTMALAGTVGVNDEWDEKNIEEQDIVAGDICSNLEEIGLQPMAMEEFDVTYGSIKHRCTPITADCKDKTSFEIIDAINPTAALCGFPRKGALEAILQIEHHPRSCYGGVVGFKTKRTIEAYVNIRCVNFNKSRFTFYAGGGIMPDSVAEDEWEETNKKIGNLKKRMLTD
ncbi:MAG: chorismate-binding protein [Bacteroidales bacterium]|nr:chorismate-binding protein [Bacteroidales bacterium]